MQNPDMRIHPQLPDAIHAASELSASLLNPTLLITLHRDIEGHTGIDGRPLGRSRKQYALRWAVFTMTYASIEAFFNDLLRDSVNGNRTLPLSSDKLRSAGEKRGLKLFTNAWGVRTRTIGTQAGNRSRWTTFTGTEGLRLYLGDMKDLRDILNHGGDPFSVSNRSGALWTLADGRKSMRIMGAEGFVQACTDLAAQTILAYGGQLRDVPTWPEPQRSGLSAEKRPSLPLLP